MKQTKKLLKAVFGSKKEGLAYIQGLMQPGKNMPTLFAYAADQGGAATEFARWMSEVTGNGAWVTEDQFYESKGFDDSHANIFVSEVIDVTDPFLVKLVKTRSPQKRVVVACRKYPKALQYVHDPSMQIVEVPPFDLEELRAEISDVLRKMA
jgi:hypothetical protein